MSLSENQRILLDAIRVRPTGVDISEAIILTGFDYKTIEQTAYELISKGYSIEGFEHGVKFEPGRVKRLVLSEGVGLLYAL
jgi:hypothetical protein